MTTPLHKILRCFNPPRNSLKPLEGLRRRPAPPHCNTPSRHPLNHDDASSQRSLGFDTATGHGTQGLQHDVPKASSNTHVLLCEVNRQTPISKRGGVRSLFLNLCREAWDCGVAPKAGLRAQRPGLKRAKFLGLDAVVGELAKRKFARWGTACRIEREKNLLLVDGAMEPCAERIGLEYTGKNPWVECCGARYAHTEVMPSNSTPLVIKDPSTIAANTSGWSLRGLLRSAVVIGISAITPQRIIFTVSA